MNFFYNTFPIFDSPLIAFTSDYSPMSAIKVYGPGISEASRPGEEAEFFVDCSQVPTSNIGSELLRLPEINFMGLSGDVEELTIAVTLLNANLYRCSYVAREAGFYLINIKFNGTHVTGSPYKIRVERRVDASKVRVDGLPRAWVLGSTSDGIRAVIDTREAGIGAKLTANWSTLGDVTDPRAVPTPCELVEEKREKDGDEYHLGVYAASFQPKETGKYALDVKYGDESVKGSPFIVKVLAPPDATKIKVDGPGIYHGLLTNFESMFFCETKGAGAGKLVVGIRGPKGDTSVYLILSFV